MISAKRETFRLEIRKRQIETAMRLHRKQYTPTHPSPTNSSPNPSHHHSPPPPFPPSRLPPEAELHQFLTQTTSILHNLQTSLSPSSSSCSYYRYQHLIDLRNKLFSHKSYLSYIVDPHYNILEVLAEVLHEVINGDDRNHWIAIWDIVMGILGQIIQFQELGQNRIIACGVLVSLGNGLRDGLGGGWRGKGIVGMMAFLGNAVRESTRIAEVYGELNLPTLVIRLLKDINPEPKDKIVIQFLFFMRSYLMQATQPIQLQKGQAQDCINVSTSIITELLQQQPNQDNLAIFEDALKIYRCLMDKQLYTCPTYDFQNMLVVICSKAYPIQLKRECLHILDLFIYFNNGDSQELDKEVLHGNLLDRIWDVPEDIKFITFNIFANLALVKHYRMVLLPFLTQIRLELHFNPQSKHLYMFLLNYLATNKFKVEETSEQCLVGQLLNTQSHDIEIMELQVLIWLGLLYNNYNQKPPLRILQAHHIKDTQLLNHILNRDPFSDNSMRNQEQGQGQGEFENKYPYYFQ